MSGRARMLRIALTGGIATGKSHVLARLAGAGVAILDADLIARQVVRPGELAYMRTVERFGRAVLTSSGEIDRHALGAVVFEDPTARAALEQIVHPEVYRAIRDRLDRLEAEDTAFAVADIPLLYETGHGGDFDRVIATVCSPEAQVARIRSRDGVTEAEARQRLAAQWPASEKATRADYVIDTTGSLGATNRQVDDLLDRLQHESQAQRDGLNG